MFPQERILLTNNIAPTSDEGLSIALSAKASFLQA